MKERTKFLLGIGVIVLVIFGVTLPFFILQGRYNFQNFWHLFFDRIFNWKAFVEAFGPIIGKIPTTLYVTILSMLIGLALGLALALVKLNRIPVLNQLRAFFVSFTRGTPLIVQLFLAYTGVPLVLKAINLNYGTSYNINAVDPAIIVIVAFSLNEAAYNSETIRSAIQSVDTGQIEAAKSLGMTGFQVFKRVTTPEALRVATAPLGNSLISLLKGTSLAFVAGVVEMTAQAQIMGGSNFRVFENYLALALVYWPMCIVLENLIRLLEWKLEIKMPQGHGRGGTGLMRESLDPFNHGRRSAND